MGSLSLLSSRIGGTVTVPPPLHQRAMNALALCQTRRRIPIASSRSRQRQRRYEVKSVIEALIVGGLERALNFDAICAKPRFLDALGSVQRKQLISRAGKIHWNLKRTSAADPASSWIPFLELALGVTTDV